MFSGREPESARPGEGSRAAAGQVRLQSRDPDEFAAALSCLGAEVHQLGRGPFLGTLHVLHLGPVMALQVSVNRAVHACGVKPGSYGFDLFTAADRVVKMQRQPVNPGEITVIGPPGEWDHSSSAGYTEHFNVTVDSEVVRRSAAVLHGADAEERFGRFCVLRPDPGAFRGLYDNVKWLLALADSRPELVETPGCRERLEQGCVDKLLWAVFSGGLTPEEPRRTASHARVVRRAIDYVVAHLDRPPLVADLCHEVGVSERTLRSAFQDLFGVGPMAYIKARRLEAVRRELKAADGDREGVRDVAARWGFAHGGNFAADYRRHFGELPSETLGRCGDERRPKVAWPVSPG